jgi:broad specificity phosphatase PhoE
MIIVSHNGFITDVLNKLLLNTKDIIKGDMSNGKNCHITYYEIEGNKYKLICSPNTLHLKK